MAPGALGHPGDFNPWPFYPPRSPITNHFEGSRFSLTIPPKRSRQKNCQVFFAFFVLPSRSKRGKCCGLFLWVVGSCASRKALQVGGVEQNFKQSSSSDYWQEIYTPKKLIAGIIEKMHDLFSWAWVKCCFTSFKKTCLFNLQTLGWSPSQAFKKGSRVTIPKRSQFAERSRSLSDLMSWFNDFNESWTMQFVCPARFLSQNVSTNKYFEPKCVRKDGNFRIQTGPKLLQALKKKQNHSKNRKNGC